MAASGRAIAAISVARHVAQEDENHDHREHRSFDQRLHGRFDSCPACRRPHRRSWSSRCRGYSLRSSSSFAVDPIAHGHFARALGAEDRERNDGLAVEAPERALFAGVVGDAAEIGQAHLAAVLQIDLGGGERLRPCVRRRARGSPVPGPPTSPRPEPRSTLVARTWRLTSAAVTPNASRRSGSSSTRISRFTPP